MHHAQGGYICEDSAVFFWSFARLRFAAAENAETLEP